MKRFRPDWHRTFVHPISKIFVSAVGELSGRGRRRRSQFIESNLAAVREECDRLQQEMQDLVQYTDAEIEHLKETIEQLRYERDALQLQVWLLEEQMASEASAESTVQPLSQNASAFPASSSAQTLSPSVPASPLPNSAIQELPSTEDTEDLLASSALSQADGDRPKAILVTQSEEAEGNEEGSLISIPRIDLSGLRLALIGGHPSTRRGVIQELQLNYGLRHVVEIPRMAESNTNRSKVKSKIGRCTLVVLITGYMSHRLTEIVYSLKDAGSLAGDVLQLNCRGKSGVVREILNHVTQAGG